MRAIFAEQIQKWISWKRFGSTNTGIFPTAVAQQFKCDYWTDCGLPQHCL
jgi:hypothetical protein